VNVLIASYPGQVWSGTVQHSPASRAQFDPSGAEGERQLGQGGAAHPVRIRIDRKSGTSAAAGMSATVVSTPTHRRTLSNLL